MTENGKYLAYGLVIDSEIALPELLEATGDADVSIRIGKAPEILNARTGRYKRFFASDDSFLLIREKVAKYYVHDGKQIIIEPLADIECKDIRLFLLGSVFSALLHQRGFFVLHGSAIEMDGEAIIFTGTSGAGKSTLAAAFAQKGYRVITDDVCAIRIGADERPMLIPGFPKIKLWKDAADRLSRDISTATPVRDGEEKYNFSTIESHCSEPLPLRDIYIIKPNEGDEISIESIESFQRILQLIRNTYRFRFLKAQGGRPLHLEQCARISKHVEMCILHRGKNGCQASDIVAYLDGSWKR
jgi:hypothetical protein